MPRPKKFDETEVLDKAINLFWQKGFNGTSMQDLVSNLGINRASLYDTFGGKHQLFMSALTRYRSTTEESLCAHLSSSKPSLTIIEELLDMAISSTCTVSQKRGCFLVNTTTELASEDQEIAKLMEENVKHKEKLFHSLIIKGQEQGEISTQHESLALARYLFSAYNGLKVVAQTRPNPQVLIDSKMVILASLKE